MTEEELQGWKKRLNYLADLNRRGRTVQLAKLIKAYLDQVEQKLDKEQ